MIAATASSISMSKENNPRFVVDGDCRNDVSDCKSLVILIELTW